MVEETSVPLPEYIQKIRTTVILHFEMCKEHTLKLLDEHFKDFTKLVFQSISFWFLFQNEQF